MFFIFFINFLVLPGATLQTPPQQDLSYFIILPRKNEAIWVHGMFLYGTKWFYTWTGFMENEFEYFCHYIERMYSIITPQAVLSLVPWRLPGFSSLRVQELPRIVPMPVITLSHLGAHDLLTIVHLKDRKNVWVYSTATLNKFSKCSCTK